MFHVQIEGSHEAQEHLQSGVGVSKTRTTDRQMGVLSYYRKSAEAAERNGRGLVRLENTYNLGWGGHLRLRIRRSNAGSGS